MKSKNLAVLCLLMGSIYAAHAQNLEESLIFSQYDQGATARFKAMGNAQTSLGGDISNISGNPAGLGFFNSNDFSVSLDYFGDRNNVNYFGQNTKSSVDRLGFNQVGLVFNLPTSRSRGSNLESGWLNFNIGIGYNKTNSFRSNLNYYGVNPNNSIGDFMVDQDYLGTSISGIGWDMGLYDAVPPETGAPYAMTSFDNNQGVENSYSGTQSETNISFGANYSNKLYLGASVGISTISYNSNSHFFEDGEIAGADNLGGPDSRFLTDNAYKELLNSGFMYHQYVWTSTRGTGANVKLGLIYRPVDMIRIGFSATTPTWYNMSDSWDDNYNIVNYDNNNNQISSYNTTTTGDNGNYAEYNLRTPYRLNGGLSAVFPRGLISADVEFVGYNSIRVSGTGDNSYETDFNNAISDNYQGAVNLKVGGELVLIPQVLLRAGYNHQGNPYKEADFSSESFTGGLGFRFGNYYVDATYQNWRQKYQASPYTFTPDMNMPSPTASVKNTRNNIFLTVGAKF